MSGSEFDAIGERDRGEKKRSYLVTCNFPTGFAE